MAYNRQFAIEVGNYKVLSCWFFSLLFEGYEIHLIEILLKMFYRYEVSQKRHMIVFRNGAGRGTNTKQIHTFSKQLTKDSLRKTPLFFLSVRNVLSQNSVRFFFFHFTRGLCPFSTPIEISAYS